MGKTTKELISLTAVAARELLIKKEITPLELIDAALERIAATDHSVNAMPTLCPDRAQAQARELMQRDEPGLLYGLPMAVKDNTAVAGVRTTFGSTIFANHVPERSDIVVERLESRGAIVIGKSNVPELSAGGTTYNKVFGTTRNPWNTNLTPGGSSGGSAAALAAGQVWLATGSDLGGSLRLPASFCGVVGLRPSPGRVARGPRTMPFDMLSVQGPMGRTVGDVALLLDAMAGDHPEDPLSLPAPATSFLQAAQNPKLPRRVAFSLNLGLVPVDERVAAVCRQAVEKLERLGVQVEEAAPDLSEATDVFHRLRAELFAGQYKHLLPDHREELRPEVVWNIEAGLKLSPEELVDAKLAQGRMYQRAAQFFADYDLLITPTVPVPPFPVDQPYITELEGVRFNSYVEWLVLSYAITLISYPAISIPCGFTDDGLPVGLQLVGRHHGEAELLRAAAALEAELEMTKTPIDPR